MWQQTGIVVRVARCKFSCMKQKIEEGGRGRGRKGEEEGRRGKECESPRVYSHTGNDTWL